MKRNELFEELRVLEAELHKPEIRSNRDQLTALLHESFVEYGRSGRRYDKEEILKQIPSKNSTESVWSQEYALQEIADDVALLLYKSAHINEDGKLTRHTNRSSLWQRTEVGWQMRFHQGTATDEFDVDGK